MAWHHDSQAAVCDIVDPWAHGTVVRAPRFPRYYDFNLVRMEGTDPGIDAAALAGLADKLLAGLDHRKVEVEDERAGERLRADFEAMGWHAERLLWMRHGGTLPAEVPEVEETGPDASIELRREWFRAEGPPIFPDERSISEFIAMDDRMAALRDGRTLVARENGEPVGYVSLLRRGSGGEVVSAYLTPRLRGRGLGGGLVSAAVAALHREGVRDVFIVADDEDRPKQLYARLGFEPAWIQHAFTRTSR